MANKAKGANAFNARFIKAWQKMREEQEEPWKIPNSPTKGWKDRLKKRFENPKKGNKKR